MKIRKYDFAYLVEAMRSEQELVSYKGNKYLYPTRMHTTYNLFYFLFFIQVLLKGKLPYDPVCPSVVRLVCHNFLKGR